MRNRSISGAGLTRGEHLLGGITGCPEIQWAPKEVEVRKHLWKSHNLIPLLQAGSARTVGPGVCLVRFEEIQGWNGTEFQN